MSSSLEKMAGGKLETAMKKLTSNKLMSFLLGAAITIAIQSSSGAMVMLVGLVNSGIIEYTKTLPIILGSNVGTTFTGWLLSLTSVGSGGFSILSLLNPKYFSPILAFVGILLKMVSKNEKKKDIGIMPDLKTFNLTDGQIEGLVQNSQNPILKLNPVEITPAMLREMYNQMR